MALKGIVRRPNRHMVELGSQPPQNFAMAPMGWISAGAEESNVHGDCG